MEDTDFCVIRTNPLGKENRDLGVRCGSDSDFIIYILAIGL